MGDTDAAFNVGDVVLAKVKGYSAWPGMIMTEELTPSAVMKAKPKGSKGKNVWPVRFFVDGSYMWGGEKELKALPKDDAQAYVDKPKNKRDKTLIEAYKVATDPPSMEDLADNADRPQASKRKSSKRQNEDEAATNGKKSAANKRRKSEVKEEKKPKKKEDVKKEEEEKTAASEEDVELQPEEVEDNSPEHIQPSFSKLKEDVAGREEQIKIIRHRLQRGFLDSAKPSDSQLPQLSSHIKTLEVNPDLEISIIRKFKVNKVLKQLLKIDDIPSDSTHRFRERAEKLLIRWSTATQETGDETNGEVTPTVEDKKENDKQNQSVKKKEEGAEEKKENVGSEEKAEAEGKKDDAASSSGKKEDEPDQEDGKEGMKNDNEPNNTAADEKPAES